MKYFIKTFGCQLNVADSERIAAGFKARGMIPAKNYQEADYVIINTCTVRQSAENRVYGLVHNLAKLKIKNLKLKIIVTGCMVGLAFRDKSDKYLQRLKTIMPEIDEFVPIEEVGFDNAPLRTDKISAWVPISNGCNNFCSFCVVPFTRGRETSRPYEQIIKECQGLKEKGYKNITLLGQNVNSYGADLIRPFVIANEVKQSHKTRLPRRFAPRNDNLVYKLCGKKNNPIYVKHLGRYRIPTLFPYLLDEVAKMGFEKVDFISSNPWDFSDELIGVTARNKNIARTIHLPVQSGDNNVLKRMNRWYSASDYVALISKIKNQISNIKFTTDIIVGFCGETDEEFKNTIKLCKQVDFEKAYIAMYSPRPMTAAYKVFKDNVLYEVKKRRWQILEDLINKPKLKKKKTEK